MGHLSARFGQMLAKINTKRRHFAWQSLVAALDRQTFQAFLVTAESALDGQIK